MNTATDWTDGPWPVDDDTYYADAAHVSHSMLDTFRESIPAYHGMHVAKTIAIPGPTPQMQFGRLFHMALLEPEAYAKESPNRKDALLIEAMRASVMAHEDAGRMLTAEGRSEVVYRWRHKKTGIACKAKADKILTTGMVVDFKTCSDPTPGAFARAIASYGYHRQDPWYSYGAQLCFGAEGPFVFVAVGKSPPHEVICYQINDEFLMLGIKQNERAMLELADCIDSGDWRSRYRGVRSLAGPRYAFYED